MLFVSLLLVSYLLSSLPVASSTSRPEVVRGDQPNLDLVSMFILFVVYFVIYWRYTSCIIVIIIITDACLFILHYI